MTAVRLAGIKLLTVRQASAVLNLSLRGVYGLVSTKALPHYPIGKTRGSIRVAKEDVEAYLAACPGQAVNGRRRLPKLAQ